MLRAQMMIGNPAYDDGDVEITDDADTDVFLLVRSDEVAVLAEQLTRFIRTPAGPAAPAGPDWDQALPEGLSSERLQRAFQATLPARLSSVQRHEDAEAGVV